MKFTLGSVRGWAPYEKGIANPRLGKIWIWSN